MTPDVLPPDALAAHLAREVAAFRAVLTETVTDPGLLGAPVTACPGWTLKDLTDHLGWAHRWVVTAIHEGHGRFEGAPGPSDPAALCAWFDEGAAALTEALDRDPDTPAWTFTPATRTVGFWQRRQPQEHLIHRYDAQAAVGTGQELDPALAADGIGEVFDVFVPRMQFRGLLGQIGHTVGLRATDVDASWVLAGPEAAPIAELAGRASDILLHLWKRTDGSNLTWSGDAALGADVIAAALTP
jgi:uncharacterized protein (TIGR03083 family)